VRQACRAAFALERPVWRPLRHRRLTPPPRRSVTRRRRPCGEPTICQQRRSQDRPDKGLCPRVRLVIDLDKEAHTVACVAGEMGCGVRHGRNPDFTWCTRPAGAQGTHVSRGGAGARRSTLTSPPPREHSSTAARKRLVRFGPEPSYEPSGTSNSMLVNCADVADRTQEACCFVA
jgi:hypothetical protein